MVAISWRECACLFMVASLFNQKIFVYIGFLNLCTAFTQFGGLDREEFHLKLRAFASFDSLSDFHGSDFFSNF